MISRFQLFFPHHDQKNFQMLKIFPGTGRLFPVQLKAVPRKDVSAAPNCHHEYVSFALCLLGMLERLTCAF